MATDLSSLRRQIATSQSLLNPAVARGHAVLLRVRQHVITGNAVVATSEGPPLEDFVVAIKDAQATALAHLSTARRIGEALDNGGQTTETTQSTTDTVLETCSLMLGCSHRLDRACDIIERRLTSIRLG